ncbi:MAG: hypothetical protein ACD_60C00032G0020 [uncultured bacterium]|nr:MAG: hypothetical protein ACD_60C00032G0020 [uncultured bacterium]
MTFAEFNLNPHIFKAIDACGYKNPTPVQAKSIPEILQGKDVVASAQTGTGKTASFVLPALHRLSTSKASHKPRILILTPTRELATQITTAVTKYGKFLRVNIASLVGGMPYRQQLRSLSKPVDIIVATPGRLLDHMSNRRLDLSAIEMLVLDEADRMLDMGFIDDVQEIARATPASRQTLLFSATVDKRLSHIINRLLKNPVQINFSNEQLTPVKISQELYMADNPQHKMRLLLHFVQDKKMFKAIIFSATKINADKLAGELSNQGYASAPLHGDLKQNVRNRTLEQLRRSKIQFLVATDVAARGIDVEDITHVINYDLPKFSEDYVHRIGRTGRAGKSGTAISLALASDRRHIERIERFMNQPLPRKTILGLEPRKETHPPKKNQASGHKKKKNAADNARKRFYADNGESFSHKPKKKSAKRSYSAAPKNYSKKPKKHGAKKTGSSDRNNRFARSQ